MSNQSSNGYLPILTLIEILILVSLAKGKLHGLGIIQFVANLTNNQVILSAATTYTALKRMYKERWIEEASHVDPDARGNAERRQYYKLSLKGRKVVADDVNRLDYLVHQCKYILKEAEQDGQDVNDIILPAIILPSPRSSSGQRGERE